MARKGQDSPPNMTVKTRHPSIKKPFSVPYVHGRKARYSGNPGPIPAKPKVGYLQEVPFKS